MIENPAKMQKDLLDKFHSGKITMKELDTECAYWYAETFDTFAPKPRPTAPIKYNEFKSMSPDMQKKLSEAFWQDHEIKSYMISKQQVKNENQAHLMRLREWIKNIPIEDVVVRQEYKYKIQDFEEYNGG